MRNRLLLTAATALGLACFGSAPSWADKSDDTLRIVWKESVPNVDPYFNQLRSGFIMAGLVMDTLIFKNPDTGEFQPLLAESWEWLDDTHLRFKLREDVDFHNGEKFDADDVVYTLNFVANPESKILIPNLGFIKGAEKVDQYTVDVELNSAFPAALDYLSSVLPMYPNEYHAEVGPEGMGKNMVGTGPYVMTLIDGVSHYVMERNEDYFDSPKGPANIGTIDVRVVNDESTELVELMAGKADWIWKYNADQVEQLAAQPNITANLSESMRIGFLNFNIIGKPGQDQADNPIANVKVRQAIAHAINKADLVEYLVGGDARVLDTPCFPAQFGCDVEAAVKYDYDPEKAKALLAEAGYPDGFETQVIGARNAQWVAAVQEDLKKVGIDADATVMQGATLVDLYGQGEVPIGYWDWGSYSIMDAAAVLPAFFGGVSSSDRVGDQEVADLIAEAGSEIDTEKRKELYSQAIHLITERALSVPIHSFVTPYAYKSDLDFTAYPDEQPRFYWAKWK